MAYANSGKLSVGVTQMDLPVHDRTDQGIRLLEEERRRIARDLHDGPAQALTNISMRLDVIRQLLTTDLDMATAELMRTNSRIVATVNDIRRLIYDLRPIAIDEVGLFTAAEELCARLAREWGLSIEISLPHGKECDMSPAKQVAVYRLLQEVLQNAHKHAQAQHITVTIKTIAEQWLLIVRDDGVGFSPDVIPEGHYGIVGMRERVSYLGGTITIDSTVGVGSQFMIAVPHTHAN